MKICFSTFPFGFIAYFCAAHISLTPMLDAHIPEGPLAQKWTLHKERLSLVAPANRCKWTVIVVGTGLAGASAASTLAQQGYNVLVFCITDSPRRAHSVAAQGGINAAKNYQNDNDSVRRLFEDTLRGGDFRAREANVYRLAELSNAIIDHCVAQGVPFARDYGGYLDNRSFGGAQVSRTFYARGQTGQQLLIGAYSALNQQVAEGRVTVYPRYEMLDLVVVDGRAQGIIARNLVTGTLERFSSHAVVVATGGYGNVFCLSTNAMNSNASALMQCYRRGAYFANPCFTQIHPTCIPVHGTQQSKLTLMSESLRNDGRIWVPKRQEVVQQLREGTLRPSQVPESERDYYLERRYPSYGNLVPRDIASRAAKQVCDNGFGVNPTGRAVYLDLSAALARLGKDALDQKYGNLVEMYEKITGTNPYQEPMMIYPAAHYTMGGLWVDYNLMTTIPGLFAIGEANFSDHGANRLGASALMQGLADGYFILPYTLPDYLARQKDKTLPCPDHPAFVEAQMNVQRRINGLLNGGIREAQGASIAAAMRTPEVVFHHQLGHEMWEHVGMSRDAQGLRTALENIKRISRDFYANVCVPGSQYSVNQELEKALRFEDYLELAHLMTLDALSREDSSGCHLRTESQTPDGEALRQDERFMYVGAWQFREHDEPLLHRESLQYENISVVTRSYK